MFSAYIMTRKKIGIQGMIRGNTPYSSLRAHSIIDESGKSQILDFKPG